MKPYCGFNAEELNSNQPIPKRKVIVYSTMHKPWAEDYAKRIRAKYGCNLWLDGTVCTGWKVIMHADMDKTGKAMLLSVVP